MSDTVSSIFAIRWVMLIPPPPVFSQPCFSHCAYCLPTDVAYSPSLKSYRFLDRRPYSSLWLPFLTSFIISHACLKYHGAVGSRRISGTRPATATWTRCRGPVRTEKRNILRSLSYTPYIGRDAIRERYPGIILDRFVSRAFGIISSSFLVNRPNPPQSASPYWLGLITDHSRFIRACAWPSTFHAAGRRCFMAWERARVRY